MRWIVGMIMCVMGLGATELHYMRGGHAVALTPVETTATLRSESTCATLTLREADGRQVTATRRLLVRFSDSGALSNVLQRYGLEVVKQYGGGLYLLQAMCAIDAIETANALYARPDVVFAHPDLAASRRLR